MLNKRDIILNAMQKLLETDRGASCSVSDIAKMAGIGKGSIYYYFESKNEIFDALVDREYNQIIENCKAQIYQSQASAIQKLSLLFESYRGSNVSTAMDVYLHQPQNAAIHQKSLAKILSSLSPIIADIIRQGVEEKVLQCDKPQETAEIIMSVFCFLYDPGIFSWTPEQLKNKASALTALLENGLASSKESFRFIGQ